MRSTRWWIPSQGKSDICHIETNKKIWEFHKNFEGKLMRTRWNKSHHIFIWCNMFSSAGFTFHMNIIARQSGLCINITIGWHMCARVFQMRRNGYCKFVTIGIKHTVDAFKRHSTGLYNIKNNHMWVPRHETTKLLVYDVAICH